MQICSQACQHDVLFSCKLQFTLGVIKKYLILWIVIKQPSNRLLTNQHLQENYDNAAKLFIDEWSLLIIYLIALENEYQCIYRSQICRWRWNPVTKYMLQYFEPHRFQINTGTVQTCDPFFETGALTIIHNFLVIDTLLVLRLKHGQSVNPSYHF